MSRGCATVSLVLLLAITTVNSDPIRKRASSVVSKCFDSEHGCCPDGETAASGPFDEGCPEIVETCNETEFHCCPDGVSPALGPDGEGCPVPSCSDMLYGCCSSDNKTPAEGNDQEGCPPPPPLCLTSEFGCCEDGKTEATGSDNAGCPELITSTTIIAPTIIKNNCTGGCKPVGSCNTSTYGCCEDGKTPAHGPDHEGCCLMTPFGCCPDNYKPAEGLNGEGCDCEYAHFGCCPDNKTIARGHNKEGCGCQYTDYGCCLDRHTTASGPDYEGCDCHTYQLGCCPDGVTVATGPNQQGCHCTTSQYGCCGDGETAASGPNQAGCDCASSMYGCCYDGISVAKGPKFYGCATSPDNKQAACSLPLDHGSCRKFAKYWYYDMVYGGCFSFWYHGCEGNDNRFDSKEDCDNVCVHPPARDACKLPKVKGPCIKNQTSWYYDLEEEQCQQFNYGECVGNANNFANKDLCEKKCASEIVSGNQCNLPIERGPCNGTFGRWGFNTERDRCEQFIWGGCEGNSNRFTSETACMMQCKPPKISKPGCSLPQVEGNCTDAQAMWSFSPAENQCVPFYYTGCMGNENRFDSFESCTEACPSAYEPNECTLPFVTGKCHNNTEKWYYDTFSEMCKTFYYGGCDGNSNNFDTREECEGRCFEPETPNNTIDICKLPVLSGPCKESQARWFYNATSDTCSQFTYGGCEGNENRFETRVNCELSCKKGPITFPPGTSITITGIQNECKLAPDLGACKSNYVMWFYDITKHECQQFNYSGCGGNNNRFKAQYDCMSFCRPDLMTTTTAANTILISTPSSTITPTTIATDGELPQNCYISSALEQCVRAGEVWYLDPTNDECMPHNNSDTGVTCRITGVFGSKEACERSCGDYIDAIDICQLPVLSGPCKESQTRWFYNATSETCSQFTYGGCKGNENRFTTQNDCISLCRPDLMTTTTAANTILISTPSSTITPTAIATDDVHQNCYISSALEQCVRAGEVWYLDPTNDECIPHNNSDTGVTCRTTGVFESKEACERSCGDFIDVIDECKLTPDLGACKSKYVMWFYDVTKHECQQFNYSGCSGNNNRFITQNDCMSFCRPDLMAATTTAANTILTSTPSSTISPTTIAIDDGLPQSCHISSALEQCVRAGEVWYLDPTYDECMPHNNSDTGVTCRTTGVFGSEEACQRSCGDFIDMIDVCHFPMDPGPYKNFVSKYYFDKESRSCKVFQYGGAQGGPNRFSTLDECIQVCNNGSEDSSTTSTSTPSISTTSSNTTSSSATNSSVPSSTTVSTRNPSFSTTSSSISNSSTPSSITISSTITSSSIPSSSIPSTSIPSSSTPSSSTLSSITPSSSTLSSSISSSNSTSSSITPSSITPGSTTPSSSIPRLSTPSSSTSRSDTLSSITPSSSTPSSITPSSSTPSSSTPSSSTPSSSTPISIIPSSITSASSTPSSSIPCSSTTSSITSSSSTLSSSISSSSTPSSIAPISSTPSSITSSTSTPSSSISSSSTSSSITPSSIAPSSSTPSFSTPGSSISGSSTPSSIAPSPSTQRSSTPSSSTAITTNAPSSTVKVNPLPKGCQVSAALEKCSVAGEVWYLDRGECVSHVNLDKGVTCRTTGVFDSQEACERSCGGFRDIDVCQYAKDSRPSCKNYKLKYYFDGKSNTCKVFRYGGCKGGPNRFSTIEECMQVCKPYTNPCKQKPKAGNCKSSFNMWYYDEARNQCDQFTYTGCGGNNNRFATHNDCMSFCAPGSSTTISSPTSSTPSSSTTSTSAPSSSTTSTSTPSSSTTSPSTSSSSTPSSIASTNSTTITTTAPGFTYTDNSLPEVCHASPELEQCAHAGVVWYLDPTSEKCVSHVNSGIGVRCRTTGVFKSQEACNRKCGIFRDISEIDLCRDFTKDSGDCFNFVSKYYFDQEIGRCKKFSYGGCSPGPNMFSTYDECHQVCSPYIDTCKLKYLEGQCLSHYVMWFYDETRDQCGEFTYTGCGGNNNRFKTLEDCENRCKNSKNV